MTDATSDVAQLKTLVEQLQKRIDELETKMLEAHPPGEVSDDVMLAISAACAAFLGKRAVIKQVHHRRTSAWAAQGRRAIHTSHNIF
ncbi:MAG: hypothetical protein IPI32_11735 [Austwickia sp.]|nr:hypothetical protein [Austwickia sp.]MBK8435846.1 hypothetical protein [Austwickia sp.]MBK9101532.1 hypothetical protein [Austwickia sp.]